MEQKYFVVLSPDQKFGPADLALLNQWAQEGRILPNTILENEASGQQVPASQLSGLIVPDPSPSGPASSSADPLSPQPQNPGQDMPSAGSAAQTPSNPFEPARNPYQQPNNPYQQPPTPQAAYQRYAAPMDDGSSDLTKSYIFSIAGLLCCCLLLPFGVVFAKKADEKGNPGAKAANIVAWVVMALYLLGIIGYAIFVFALAGTGAF